MPSFGANCEKPVSTDARRHAGSSSTPSIVMVASIRGGSTLVWPARPTWMVESAKSAAASSGKMVGSIDGVGAVG